MVGVATPQKALRIWLGAFLSAIAVLGCVFYADRPLAEFFDASVRHTAFWVWLNRFLAPLVVVPLAALFFLLGSGCWLMAGRALPAWTATPLLCSWSLMWGLAAEIIFKRIFGRAWPDPTYLQEHLYGFHWLHSSEHWSSFPSGTSMGAGEIAAVLWIRAPRWRPAAFISGAAVLAALLATNGHWLSDVIAGAFLGVSIGWMTVRLSEATSPPSR